MEYEVKKYDAEHHDCMSGSEVRECQAKVGLFKPCLNKNSNFQLNTPHIMIGYFSPTNSTPFWNMLYNIFYKLWLSKVFKPWLAKAWVVTSFNREV